MFFQVEPVTERIIRIAMPYVCCYLIIGDEEAVLLDCGWGYGDIKALAKSLTDRPITLVLSHGNIDHVGGASQFDIVYLNENDFNFVDSQTDVSLCRKILATHVPVDFQEGTDLWQPARSQSYTPLTEDSIFDLDNHTLQPYHLPGHSLGCMVFIIPEESMAIFGDAISHPTLMSLDHSTDIQTHYDAMVRFSAHEHLYQRVLVNHETFELDKIVLENNIKLAKAILDNKDARILASARNQRTPGLPVYMA